MNDQSYTIAADELRQFIERIEQLEREKADIAEQVRETMAEAKGRGYDGPAIRTILKMRKKDRDDLAEAEAIVEMYRAALGMN